MKTIRFSVNTQWQSKKNEKSIFKMMIIIFARNLNEIDRLICLLFFIKYIQFQTSKKQKTIINPNRFVIYPADLHIHLSSSLFFALFLQKTIWKIHPMDHISRVHISLYVYDDNDDVSITNSVKFFSLFSSPFVFSPQHLDIEILTHTVIFFSRKLTN